MVKLFAEPPPFPPHPKNRNRVIKTACSGQWRSHGRAGHSKKYTHRCGLSQYPCLLPQGSPALSESFRIKMIPASDVCSKTGSCAGQTGLGDPSLKTTTVLLGCSWVFIQQHHLRVSSMVMLHSSVLSLPGVIFTHQDPRACMETPAPSPDCMEALAALAIHPKG